MAGCDDSVQPDRSYTVPGGAVYAMSRRLLVDSQGSDPQLLWRSILSLICRIAFPRCPFLATLTGLQCPGCGMQRAVRICSMPTAGTLSSPMLCWWHRAACGSDAYVAQGMRRKYARESTMRSMAGR